MNITQYRSSTYILELEGKKILFDPWLVNGSIMGHGINILNII